MYWLRVEAIRTADWRWVEEGIHLPSAYAWPSQRYRDSEQRLRLPQKHGKSDGFGTVIKERQMVRFRITKIAITLFSYPDIKLPWEKPFGNAQGVEHGAYDIK